MNLLPCQRDPTFQRGILREEFENSLISAIDIFWITRERYPAKWTLAATKKITLPADIGSSNKSTLDKLKGLSGADFDKEYVKDMVSDHETDVKAFEKQADNSTDPEVKAFAAKTLPVLKKHLDAIKAIQSKMK